jgi:hypothetical protein
MVARSKAAVRKTPKLSKTPDSATVSASSCSSKAAKKALLQKADVASIATSGLTVQALLARAAAPATTNVIEDSDGELVVGAGVGGQADGEEEPNWTCDICPRKFASWNILNVGCKRYAKYRCKPCHAAQRSLERSLKTKHAKVQAFFFVVCHVVFRPRLERHLA